MTDEDKLKADISRKRLVIALRFRVNSQRKRIRELESELKSVAARPHA